MRGFQFLIIQDFATLGEGQSPMNYPINPHSDRFREVLHDLDAGRVTTGISAIFLTNFGFPGVAGFFPSMIKRDLKVATSGGTRGGTRSSVPHPWHPSGIAARKCTCQRDVRNPSRANF